jgi:predicted transcriptional regulator
MRTTKIVSITLPPALYDQARALAKEENRTLSELFREAFRRYERERFWEMSKEWTQEPADRLGLKTEEDVVELVRQVRREMAEEEAAKSALRPTGTE